jgi:hypothetical protein
LIGTGVDPRSVVEENEIEPPQWLRHPVGVDPPADDRRETLVPRGCAGKLFQRHLGRHRIGA